jgi:hypothetical protein
MPSFRDIIHKSSLVVCRVELDFYEQAHSTDFVADIRGGLRFARSLAISSFPFEVEFATKIEEGSYKVTGTVIAALHLILSAIEHYGALRDGLERICDDARKYGKQAVRFVEVTVARKAKSPFSPAVHLGLPGVLKQIAHETAFLAEHVDDLSVSEMKMRLGLLKEKIDALEKAARTADEHDALGDFVSELCDELVRQSDHRIPPLPQFPTPLQWGRIDENLKRF